MIGVEDGKRVDFVDDEVNLACLAPVGKYGQLLGRIDGSGGVIGLGEDEHPEAGTEFGVSAVQVGEGQRMGAGEVADGLVGDQVVAREAGLIGHVLPVNGVAGGGEDGRVAGVAEQQGGKFDDGGGTGGYGQALGVQLLPGDVLADETSGCLAKRFQPQNGGITRHLGRNFLGSGPAQQGFHLRPVQYVLGDAERDGADGIIGSVVLVLHGVLEQLQVGAHGAADGLTAAAGEGLVGGGHGRFLLH